MAHRTRRDAGYTLLETLTVVGITLVMAGLAVASMAPLRERTVVRQGAEQVQQLLQAARRKAMSSARCYRLEIADATGAAVPAGTAGTHLALRRFLRVGCDFPAPPALPQPVDADFDRTDRVALPQGVTARVVGPPDVLDLLPSGRPRPNGGGAQLRVEVRRDLEAVWVDVAPAGAVCLQVAGASGDCP